MIDVYQNSKRVAALFASFAFAGSLGIASAVAVADETARQAQGEPASPEAQAEALEVSDEKLEQFLAAAINVQDVQREYVAEIQAAEDPAEAENLREAAQEEMVTAVEDSGLSVLEFNLIAQRLQTDATLVQRLDDLQRE
jgi:hypothetical protein